MLVNNAGIFQLAPVAQTAPDAFLATLDANLVAPFRLVRALLPGMLARGSGHVVTIGSVADRATFPENGAYAASKYWLRALHEVLRAELRGTGVRGAAAMRAVASPMPKPISSTRGAARPNTASQSAGCGRYASTKRGPSTSSAFCCPVPMRPARST